MWRTPRGDRALRGAEWELFRAGLDSLRDWIEATLNDPRAHRTGVRVFDRLQPGQKLAMLALVGEALSDEGVTTPELTAPTEGAAAAVYRFLRDEVTAEIDMAGERGPDEDPTHWRSLIMAAFVEAEAEGEDETAAGREPEGPYPEADEDEGEDAEPRSVPPVDSADFDNWEGMLDALTERLFWDADYEMEAEFADADPAEAATRKRLMHIRDDYFTAIAPDPTEEQLEEVRRTLARVCGRPEPEESPRIDGLFDSHHDLFVGPCDEEAVERETVGRMIGGVSVSRADPFDCTHAEWVEFFRDDARRAAAEPQAGPAEPSQILAFEPLTDVARASFTGETLVLEDGTRVELQGTAWIVAHADGSVLVDVEDPCWCHDSDDPGSPPVRFDGPGEALAAYLHARAILEARRGRCRAAFRRLGREDPEGRADRAGVRA